MTHGRGRSCIIFLIHQVALNSELLERCERALVFEHAPSPLLIDIEGMVVCVFVGMVVYVTLLECWYIYSVTLCEWWYMYSVTLYEWRYMIYVTL